ncbi:major facilitator superfamily MFS_1 [Methanofollis liminatans DSM 4140]|uniref:Major facilitator superfamily MFS_1 n=1 Tax=Methanofollis liminatans DSM 4140 TaxID=28892 RepID=J1L3J1_9EURY|nr:MFS transporter [Methanofollis liminatans]EJG07290.1 major facilitator superfamily MFS_1 [Methanofollis liminatans DSM 4140]
MKPPFNVTDPRYHLCALVVLSAVVVTVMFTEAMLTPALPLIQDEFGISGVWTSLILTSVLLVGAIITPVIGKCGDLFGKKRMMLVCIAIYAAGVVASGWATDIGSLLLFRALQGTGLGMFPLCYALIREQFPPERVPVAVGTIAAMFGAGTLLGIFVGSWIVGLYSWRMTFHLVAPAVFILLALTAIVIIPSPPRAGAPIDRAGMAAFTLTLLSFVLALTLGGTAGWSSPGILLLILMTAVFGALFVRVEAVAEEPMLDLSMVQKLPVLIALVIGLIVVMATFMLIQTLPYLIESPTGLGLPALAVGLILMPGSVADMISGPATGAMVGRWGVRPAMVLGSALLLVGALLYLFTGPSVAVLVIAGVLFNAGMSVTLTGNTIIVIRAADAADTGAWTAVYHTSQNIGGMIGPVIAGAFLTGFAVNVPGWTAPMPSTEAFHLVFVAISVLSLATLLLSLRVRDSET